MQDYAIGACRAASYLTRQIEAMMKRVVICDAMIALAAGGLPAEAQDGAADLPKGWMVRTPAGMAS
ncbi:MAG TPA: hypothetical protein VNZ26_30870 [Vicinamibacterales bacterium]|nr:hypothetical protein [Vicinamibacterales bacterium]